MAEPIARGEVVCVKGGRLVDRATLERHRAVVQDAELQVADDLDLAPLAAVEFEGVMMFLNHTCEPNVGVQGQIVFATMRHVAAGEELTLDNATIDHGAEPMACRCGVAACRGVVSGEDWRKPDLQRKYDGYSAWHLQRRLRAQR